MFVLNAKLRSAPTENDSAFSAW